MWELLAVVSKRSIWPKWSCVLKFKTNWVLKNRAFPCLAQLVFLKFCSLFGFSNFAIVSYLRTECELMETSWWYPKTIVSKDLTMSYNWLSYICYITLCRTWQKAQLATTAVDRRLKASRNPRPKSCQRVIRAAAAAPAVTRGGSRAQLLS